MRATAPASTSAGTAVGRGAATQSSDPAASSNSFSALLVGRPSPSAATTTGVPAPSVPAGAASEQPSAKPGATQQSSGAQTSASTASSAGSRQSPVSPLPAQALPSLAALGAGAGAGKASLPRPTGGEPASAEGAEPDSLPASTASIAASEQAATTTSTPAIASTLAGAADAIDAGAAAVADPDQSAPEASATPASASGKSTGRRAAASAAADTNQLGAQAAWLMAATMSSPPAGAVGVAAPAAEPQSDAQDSALSTTAALSGLSSAAGAAVTAAPASAGTTAHALSAQNVPALLGGADAGALALGTGASTLEEDASTDTGGDSGGASGDTAAAGDRARDATDVSSTDLSALANLARSSAAGVGQSASTERSVGTPVGDPGWSRAVASQIQMMASSNMQSATLRLSPEHLGPVEVRIDMQAGQINVNFVAAHPETRSALEQSVPTLRAMLAHGGLTLGQSQVRGEARSGSQSNGSLARDGQPAAPEDALVSARISRGVGLIDEYA
jgi:flagellar hook-length control protein FliK